MWNHYDKSIESKIKIQFKMELTEEIINQRLSKAMHPEINSSLLELGMIKDVKLKNSEISLTLLLPFLNVPIKDMLIQIIKDSLKSKKVKIKIAEMNEKEKEKFMEMAQQGWRF